MSRNLKPYCSEKINKSETEITKEIQDYLRRILGAYINKNHGNAFQKPGRPDLEGCINGFHIGIEVKENKGVASEEQKVHIRNIIKAGGSGMFAWGDKALYDVVEWLENEGII